MAIKRMAMKKAHLKLMVIIYRIMMAIKIKVLAKVFMPIKFTNS